MYYLTKKREKAENWCQKHHFIGSYEKDNKQNIVYGHLRCKSYFCRKCAPKNAKKLKARILALGIGPGWTHCVLTWDPNKGNIAEAVRGAPACWSRLRKRLKRRYPQLKYVWVLELTKKGYPHYHILFNTSLPKFWLSAVADECGLGRITYVTGVQGEGAAHYICKYITKFEKYPDELLNIFAEFSPRKYSFARNLEPIWENPHPALNDVMICTGDMIGLLIQYILKYFPNERSEIDLKEVPSPWT